VTAILFPPRSEGRIIWDDDWNDDPEAIFPPPAPCPTVAIAALLREASWDAVNADLRSCNFGNRCHAAPCATRESGRLPRPAVGSRCHCRPGPDRMKAERG